MLAWLGPPKDSTDLAINLIKRVGTIAEADDVLESMSKADYTREQLEKYESVSNEESEQLGIPFSDTASWGALSAFYDNPWFERM